jgi:hypothetical protein
MQKTAVKQISKEELQKHNKEDDLWISVCSEVYDVTHYSHSIPLLPYGGRSVTIEFARAHMNLIRINLESTDGTIKHIGTLVLDDCEKKVELEKLALEEFIQALEIVSDEALEQYIKSDYMRKIVMNALDKRIDSLKAEITTKIEKQCPKKSNFNAYMNSFHSLCSSGPSDLYDYIFNWPQ